MRRPARRSGAWRRLRPAAAAALLLGAAACGGDAGGESADGAVGLPPGMGMPQPASEPAPTPPAIPFAQTTPRHAVTVAQSWPHDPQAFTQGLVVHDGVLYESTGLEGQTSVRQVELASGRVLRRVDLPRPYFGEGIAVLDGRLYQLTWKDGRAFVYDAATLAPRDTFTYEGEGWGLTTDGDVLYMSDGTARLRVVDPDGFRVTRTIAVTEGGRPVPYLNELEWVKGELWANVWLTDLVARIDPATGEVRGYVDLAGLLTPQERARVDVTNGIAYDAARDRLLVTGKLWPRLFAVEVEGR
jgi:glutamine cyclotransferase